MTSLLIRLFVRDYRNTASPAVRRGYGTVVSVTGTVLNFFLFAAKFLVGTATGSVSVVADAVNNLSDAGSQVISFISFRISAKPADRAHPFGHGRIEYIASMVVSLLILFIGAELLKESVLHIITPEPPKHTPAALAVLLLSVLVKLWLAYFNRTVAKRIDSSVMRATAADSLSDALSTSAVLVSATVLLCFPQCKLNLDAYMGVIVAIMILLAGLKILNEAKNAILGEAPPDEVIRQIHSVVENYPEALGIHDLTVHNYGPGHVVAALHIEVDGKADVFVTHDVIDRIEQTLRREHGIEATIHMDPIVTDDKTVFALREEVLACARAVDERLCIHDFRLVAGVTHSNLIFDVSVPFEVKITDGELKELLSDRISRLHPDYFSVITVDRV